MDMKIPGHWTETGKARNWLHKYNATVLEQYGGFIFFEDPISGDEDTILAVVDGSGPAAAVYDTQEYWLSLVILDLLDADRALG